MAVTLPRDLYFLTRGDFFRKRFYSWFLGETHQVPIFRSEDGFDKLRSNQDTFAYCYKALEEGKVIIIFPETKTETEKRLRPIQKGAARIALSAARIPEIETPLRILPVGVTFSDPVTYRSTVTFRYGDLIEVRDPGPETDDRAFVNTLTDEIERSMQQLITWVKDPEREPLYDAIQILMSFDADIPSFPAVSHDPAFPGYEHALAQKINALTDDETAVLKKDVQAYHQLLKSVNLTERYLHQKFFWTPVGKLLLPVLSILLILGKVMTAPPSMLVHGLITGRIKRIPFYGPTKWALGLVSYAFWFLIVGGFGAWIGGWWGFLGALFLIMTGILNLQHFHDLNVRGLFAPWTLSKSVRGQLRDRRNAIRAKTYQGLW